VAAPPALIWVTLGGSDVALAKAPQVKILAYLALVLLLAGCIPIGARVSNMYAQACATPVRI
jgi:hypothetical protein